MKLESISVAGKDANQSGVGKKFFNNINFYHSIIKSFNRKIFS